VIDSERLRKHLTRRLPVALDALRQMVGVNSFTHNAAGVDRVGDLTAELFSPLGLDAERVQAIECATSERPKLGRHLFLRRTGASGPRVGLVGHLDTVYTETDEVANDFCWRAMDDRVYGPGTVDMKGGNVLIWMVLDAIRELSPALFDGTDWCVMFNAAEEGLASQFPILARSTLGHNASACLIYEAGDLSCDRHYLINRRKGSIGLEAIARGRAAHAGSRHEHGANAIVQMGDLLFRLHAITDYAKELTCNVGFVCGGSVPNQVPDRARAMIELRAFEPNVLESGLERVMQLDGLSTVASVEDGYRATVELTCSQRHRPWPHNQATESLVRIAKQCGDELGISVDARGRGGLSDGNFLWDVVPTVDGLGPVGANLHCASRSTDGSSDQEYVLPASFVPKAMLSVRMVERLLAP
jgi:glutamate carboxypeptidase